MKTHFPWKELGYAAGSVCLLLALYVGAYFALVSRENVIEHQIEERTIPYAVTTCVMVDGKPVEQTTEKSWTCPLTVPVFRVGAKYPLADVFGSDSLRSFFSPIHDLDRQVRTEFWEAYPEIESADLADDPLLSNPPLEPIPASD